MILECTRIVHVVDGEHGLAQRGEGLLRVLAIESQIEPVERIGNCGAVGESAVRTYLPLCA